jgi:uncharacterized GH25 family protein
MPARILPLLIILLGFAAPLRAHFLFIVPAADGKTGQVIFSEDLTPDKDVDIAIAKPAQLFARDAAGNATDLPIDTSKEDYTVTWHGGTTSTLHGVLSAGVMQRGESPAFLLIYHPKTILGDPFDPQTTLGHHAPIELIPVGKPGALQFKLVAGDKPIADSELTVITPDGQQAKATTDADGLTKPFTALGRYGVWARHFETTPGEQDGKAYEQVRRYPTLVIDVAESPNPSATSQTSTKFVPLPVAVSSFGAVGCDGWLYVYGGHAARTHSYSTESCSRRFDRLNLAEGKTWESLPGGPGLQGMNLAAHGGKVIRVGGMEPRNKPKDPVENYSLTLCERFDPATNQWHELPPLPSPRSSHDMAVVGDKLYVIGGWNLQGTKGEEWIDHALVMDLSASEPTWQKLEQPFQRRALTAAVLGDKIYVFGGFTEEEAPSLAVDILDTASGQWTVGPELPGKKMNGFAPAACELDGRLYVSVGDGSLHRLAADGSAWERVAETTPRIVHRLVPFDSKIFVIGGAAKGNNFDLIEVVQIAANSATSTESSPE